MHEYVCTWMIYGFLLYRPSRSSSGGACGGWREDGRSLTPGGHTGLHIRHCTTRWWLYIMHPWRGSRRVTVTQVQRCTHTVHPSVSCRRARRCLGGCTCVENGRVHYTCNRFCANFLFLSLVSLSSPRGIGDPRGRDSRSDDTSGEFASLEFAAWAAATTPLQSSAFFFPFFFSLRSILSMLLSQLLYEFYVALTN